MPSRDAYGDFRAALLADDPDKLYDQAPCGYLSTTSDGLVVKVNQTFLTWTGLAREELVGERRFAELLTVGGRIYHETHFAPMLHLQGAVREMALDVLRVDGETLPVLVNAVLERGAGRHPSRGAGGACSTPPSAGSTSGSCCEPAARAEAAETRALGPGAHAPADLDPARTRRRSPGSTSRPCTGPAGDGAEVGGDFYDVFQVTDDDWVFVLGDVSGKGVEAAVLTSLIRYTRAGPRRSR